ncbi:MAG: FAD-dependent oxidoreductase [Lachnospiraceae bacterium]|nr:FAD-dependent oxidoreductase [Lachnospiraceae bacterium]
MKPAGDSEITLSEWTGAVQDPERRERCDVLVVGGGTAGALAALHAARGGARTVIIEQQYALGGTSTVGGVSTYWFGNRYRDVREIDRETDRYMEWLGIPRRQGIWSDDDDFHPGVRAWVLQRLCLEAGVQMY